MDMGWGNGGENEFDVLLNERTNEMSVSTHWTIIKKVKTKRSERMNEWHTVVTLMKQEDQMTEFTNMVDCHLSLYHLISPITKFSLIFNCSCFKRQDLLIK